MNFVPIIRLYRSLILINCLLFLVQMGSAFSKEKGFTASTGGGGVPVNSTCSYSISSKYILIDIGKISGITDILECGLKSMSENGNLLGSFKVNINGEDKDITFKFIGGKFSTTEQEINGVDSQGNITGSSEERACYWTVTDSSPHYLSTDKGGAGRIYDDGTILGWERQIVGTWKTEYTYYDRNWVLLPDLNVTYQGPIMGYRHVTWNIKTGGGITIDPIKDSNNSVATQFNEYWDTANHDAYNGREITTIDNSHGADDEVDIVAVDKNGISYGSCKSKTGEIGFINICTGGVFPNPSGYNPDDDGGEWEYFSSPVWSEPIWSAVKGIGSNLAVIPNIDWIFDVNQEGVMLAWKQGKFSIVEKNDDASPLDIYSANSINYIQRSGTDSAQVVGEQDGWAVLAEKNLTTKKYEPKLLQGELTSDFKGALHSASFIANSGIIACKGVDKDNHPTAFLMIPAEIVVDANRDGRITPALDNPSGKDSDGREVDVTSSDKPYRFWLNDDDDVTKGSVPSGDRVPPLFPDNKRGMISTKRNLEDFSRFWIRFGNLTISSTLSGSQSESVPSTDIRLGLKWTDVTGDPAIRIYADVDEAGGNGAKNYLTSTIIAENQLSGFQNNCIKSQNGRDIIDKSLPFIFKVATGSINKQIDTWTFSVDYRTRRGFLFEGVREGKGKLTLVLLNKDGQELAEGPGVWIDLKNIKKMYQRGISAPTHTEYPYSYVKSQPPDPGIELTSVSTIEKPWDETPQCVIFVHGYNVPKENWINTAETTYKRLWWQGYKGRFAAFYWPTFGNGSTLPGGALGTYNDSEYRAWNSAKALKDFRSRLPSQYSKSVMAHSMGNVVVSEAIRQGMNVKSYVMLHAATSASCYNKVSIAGPNPAYPITNPNSTAPEYGEFATKAYWGWLRNIDANVINFTDYRDSVITTWWDVNNSLFRPQQMFLAFGDFRYDTDNGKVRLSRHVPGSYDFRFVNRHDELKAYANYSLTGSIGRKNQIGEGTVVKKAVDTVNTLKFGDDHSWEWGHSIQEMNEFNSYLKANLGITDE